MGGILKEKKAGKKWRFLLEIMYKNIKILILIPLPPWPIKGVIKQVGPVTDQPLRPH
jgi:hypothetical protein